MHLQSSIENSYVIGQVYYRVTYPDVKMLYPCIESFVFLGMNLSDEDKEDIWYFQSVTDYALHGSALEGVERPVSCAAMEELVDFSDVDQLRFKLADADTRRNRERMRIRG
jgi:hypothetical protein